MLLYFLTLIFGMFAAILFLTSWAMGRRTALGSGLGTTAGNGPGATLGRAMRYISGGLAVLALVAALASVTQHPLQQMQPHSLSERAAQPPPPGR